MTKKISFKRFIALMVALITVLAAFPTVSAFAAEDYNGGQGYTWWGSCAVYDSPSFTNQIGTIYEREGYTVLQNYWEYQYVEYSSSSGAKRGYIRFDPTWETKIFGRTCVAKMTANMTVYYGPDSSRYGVAGTVYTGELVTVIGRNDIYPIGNGYYGGWLHIEYNTASGRKSGYIIDVNNQMFNRPGKFPDFPFYLNAGKDAWISGKLNVYSGPGEGYPTIGSVQDENVTSFECVEIEGKSYTYIEYNTATTRKSGYLLGDYMPRS